jgi:MMP 1-O-methyltransferase
MTIDRIKKGIGYLTIRNKIKEYKAIDGWLTRMEAYGLYHCASMLPKDAVVVEIGTWKGKSTYCIAQGLKSGKIFSIDPFDASGEEESAVIYNSRKGDTSLVEQFKSSMTELGVIGKITPMKGLSNQFVGKFPQIDFLFIDGDHSIEGCTFDFMNYGGYVKKGGYIAFHDYDATRDNLGPTWTIHKKVLTSGEYEFYDLYHSLWVARKIV